jgi:hypothetical protein
LNRKPSEGRRWDLPNEPFLVNLSEHYMSLSRVRWQENLKGKKVPDTEAIFGGRNKVVVKGDSNRELSESRRWNFLLDYARPLWPLVSAGSAGYFHNGQSPKKRGMGSPQCRGPSDYVLLGVDCTLQC